MRDMPSAGHRWRVTHGQPDPATVERLLRLLPTWFGIESAVTGYIESARRLPTYLARRDDPAGEGEPPAGVLLAERHFPHAAEIHLMAVDPARHRQGIGRMPVLDGLRAARKVLAVCPQTRVLILTTFDADEYVYEALRAGASGFLLKDAPAELPEELRQLTTREREVLHLVARRLSNVEIARELVAEENTVKTHVSGS